MCFANRFDNEIVMQHKQERITFHRGANFTKILVFNDLERSTIGEKSIKV